MLFPELEAVYSVYKKDNELNVAHDGNLIPLNEIDLITVQKWRSRTNLYSWIRPVDFPWTENIPQHHSQLQMTDEHENRMLLLCFISPEDKLKNIVAICFPKQTKFFGLQKEMQDFTTDEKVIVGEMMHQLLGFEYHQAIQERESLLLMNRFQNRKNESLSENDTAPFEKFFLQSCTEILNEINHLSPAIFTIEQRSLAFLADHCQQIGALKLTIEKACELSLMLEPESKHHTLNALHFETILEATTNIEINTTDKDQRVIDLLNRYEDAAFKAQKYGHLVNGKNVARFMTPEISPPAVTDALKKNSIKIEKLLSQHPNEWKLIRNALKPLREMEGYSPLRISV